MSHSAVVFPPSYSAFELLPEGEDYWFTDEELVSFIHYTQPRYNWDRLPRAWPWRWEDGDRKFSAYAVWRRLNEQGNQHLMPADFRAYFEAKQTDQQRRRGAPCSFPGGMVVMLPVEMEDDAVA